MSTHRFDGKKLILTENDWLKKLSPEQFNVLRKAGTEPPFHNDYCDNKKEGHYVCAGCALALFNSDDKFDSGTGWPSFSQPIYEENIAHKQEGFFLKRVEVLCPRCGGHLGHVFDDGPEPTGKRYCMNSAALTFVPKK